MLFVTLSINYLYLLAIIYKPVIICKDCYVAVTTPINKNLHLLLYTISTRFPRTLGTHSFVLTWDKHTPAHIVYFLTYSPNLHTYLSIGDFCFAGPPSCSLNKGNSMSNVQSTRAHLSHIQSDVCQLRILVSTNYIISIMVKINGRRRRRRRNNNNNNNNLTYVKKNYFK